MYRKLVVANWKMNLPADGIVSYLDALASRAKSPVDMIVAPPFPFLRDVIDHVHESHDALAVAGQNCSDRSVGAFTGEVSPAMLVNVGASYVILGHSERRTLFAEDDSMIGNKIATATRAGLTPIFCIGEDLATRERGATDEWIENQLVAALEEADTTPPEIIIAYEPIWAIGTGKNATAEEVGLAHQTIRRTVEALPNKFTYSILYGGSVTPENVESLTEVEEVDGFLVGGASLHSAKFLAIYDALRRRKAGTEKN